MPKCDHSISRELRDLEIHLAKQHDIKNTSIVYDEDTDQMVVQCRIVNTLHNGNKFSRTVAYDVEGTKI